jgi:hypothetical protein
MTHNEERLIKLFREAFTGGSGSKTKIFSTTKGGKALINKIAHNSPLFGISECIDHDLVYCKFGSIIVIESDPEETKEICRKSPIKAVLNKVISILEEIKETSIPGEIKEI